MARLAGEALQQETAKVESGHTTARGVAVVDTHKSSSLGGRLAAAHLAAEALQERVTSHSDCSAGTQGRQNTESHRMQEQRLDTGGALAVAYSAAKTLEEHVRPHGDASGESFGAWGGESQVLAQGESTTVQAFSRGCSLSSITSESLDKE